MPERQNRNSYAAPAPRTDGSAPNPAGDFIWGGPGRYSVPGIYETTDPNYTTGFSPELKSGGSSTGAEQPDAIRIGSRKLNGPTAGGNYNDPKWRARQNVEKLERQTEDHTEEMWKVRQQRLPAPNVPIWKQERPPTRPTATNSPTGYYFQRPWHIPRNVKDVLGEQATAHFSMADHRRKYEIMGQKPQGRIGVNTYRATPRPWDENLVIVPPSGPNVTGGIAGNRAWRLQ